METSHPSAVQREGAANAPQCGQREPSVRRCVLSVGRYVVLMIFLPPSVCRRLQAEPGSFREGFVFCW